jgi:hypothetical protein
MLYRSYADNVTRPPTMTMRIEPVRISILQVLFRACACGRKRSLAFRATEQKHMSKLCGGCLHVVLLVRSRGAKGTEGFRIEQLSTRRVIILFPMPRTFSAINKDLEITQRKLSATSNTEQRRFLLRRMRQLLEQADNLVQKLEREIPPESKRD